MKESMRIWLGERDRWVCGICQDRQRPVRKPPGAVAVSLERLVAEDALAGDVIDGPWEDMEDAVASDCRHCALRTERVAEIRMTKRSCRAALTAAAWTDTLRWGEQTGSGSRRDRVWAEVSTGWTGAVSIRHHDNCPWP
jgi:hypothetical protein